MENLEKLSQLKVGETAYIFNINGLEEKKHKRLIELGFVNSASIVVLKKNVFSKLMLIGIRGFTICLDYNLANCIFVKGVK